MIPAIRSEFRKLLTVRSTYVLILIPILLGAGVSFYFEGYRGNTGSPASGLTDEALKSIISSNAGIMALFLSVIAILFMGHEYRYNTILYTLTSRAHRLSVLASKIVVIGLFSVLVGLAGIGLMVGAYLLGLELRNADLPAQNLNEARELLKLVSYFLAYGLMGLLIGTLMRSVVGGIAFLLLFPITIEPLLSLVLKKNAAYLPFSALDNIMGNSFGQNNLSMERALVVSAIYLVVGWAVASLLFLRRDAN